MIVAASSTMAEHVQSNEKQTYQRCLLQHGKAEHLKVDDLIVGEPYLFFYPFITTPCLLINLGKPVVTNDDWKGGVGPDKSIVAYSAICSHKMSHPAKEISFINYRHDPISFYSREDKTTVEKSGMISCCSERSVYDPSKGARVLSGPAPHPLAAIELEYNESTAELHATGSYGADMYERFFKQFGFRASIEHKVSDPKTLAKQSASVVKLTDYSKQTIKC